MTTWAAALPFLSVLLGAGMTYWLNVRQRRRTKVEDILHDAIGSVAAMIASREFFTGLTPTVSQWTAEDAEQLSRRLTADALTEYTVAVRAGRRAVAHASAYFDDLSGFLQLGGAEFADAGEAILVELRRLV